MPRNDTAMLKPKIGEICDIQIADRGGVMVPEPLYLRPRRNAGDDNRLGSARQDL